MEQINSVLIVGATGSIGYWVVDEAVKQGFQVSALVRDIHRARFDKSVHLIQGDLTQPIVLNTVDAVIFAQGSYNSEMAESVDYNGLRNVLNSLKGNLKRIALMTSIYATSEQQNSRWKRRAERLVRASGIAYTIIRPSWFDTNKTNELSLMLTQDNSTHKYWFSAKDGGVARCQIAETLVKSLKTVNATNRTVALFSERGEQTTDFDALFNLTISDHRQHNFDGINDPNNLPLDEEPKRVLQDLAIVHEDDMSKISR